MKHVTIQRSRAYANFRSAAGQSNHLLITILVGLDAVGSGSVEKNPKFSTTWEPRDVARSASRSRAYAISTSLVWISDLVDVYRHAVQQLPGVCSEVDLKRIHGAKDDGRSRRLGRLSRHLGLETSAELALVQIGFHWRNRVAHSEASGLVDGDVRGALRLAEKEIRESYSGLDVEELIKHEASGHPPTFKEIASIMAASHRLVEKLDAALATRVDVVQLAEAALKDEICRGPHGDWVERTLSLWPGTPEKTAAKLTRILLISGFQETPTSDGRVALPTDYLPSLARLSVQEARTLFPCG